MTLEGGAVGGRGDHNAFGERVHAPHRGDEIGDLAPALAHEAEHDHLRVRACDDLRHQRGFARGGRTEDADALAFAHCDEAVDRADAGGDGAGH